MWGVVASAFIAGTDTRHGAPRACCLGLRGWMELRRNTYGQNVSAHMKREGLADLLQVRVPLADATVMKAPEGIEDNALVLMADIFPTGDNPSPFLERQWI